MPSRDAMPPWIRDSLTLPQLGGLASVTAMQGTPVQWTPVQRMNDGLHPVQAGPVDSVTGAAMIAALIYACHRQHERDTS